MAYMKSYHMVKICMEEWISLKCPQCGKAANHHSIIFYESVTLKRNQTKFIMIFHPQRVMYMGPGE